MPEKLFQKPCGMLISAVDALRSSVNSMIETDKAQMTTTARFEIYLAPASEAPMTMGSKGKMHGASTVNIPAKTAMRKKIILLDF